MTCFKNSYNHTCATTQRAAVDLSLSENPLEASLEASPRAIDTIVLI